MNSRRISFVGVTLMKMIPCRTTAMAHLLLILGSSGMASGRVITGVNMGTIFQPICLQKRF